MLSDYPNKLYNSTSQDNMVEQYLEQINKRKSDILDITGQNSTIEQQQIAELYIESENIRREAYEEINSIKQNLLLLAITVG